MKGLKQFVRRLGWTGGALAREDLPVGDGFSIQTEEEMNREFPEDTLSLVGPEYWTRLEKQDQAEKLAWNLWEKCCEADQMAKWAKDWVKHAQSKATVIETLIKNFQKAAGDCPKCDGQLRYVDVGRGPFWGCENYNHEDVNCRFSRKATTADTIQVEVFRKQVRQLREVVTQAWDKVRAHWAKVRDIRAEAYEMGKTNPAGWAVMFRLQEMSFDEHMVWGNTDDVDQMKEMNTSIWTTLRDSHCLEMAIQDRVVEEVFSWGMPTQVTKEEAAEFEEQVLKGNFDFSTRSAA